LKDIAISTTQPLPIQQYSASIPSQEPQLKSLQQLLQTLQVLTKQLQQSQLSAQLQSKLQLQSQSQSQPHSQSQSQQINDKYDNEMSILTPNVFNDDNNPNELEDQQEQPDQPEQKEEEEEEEEQKEQEQETKEEEQEEEKIQEKEEKIQEKELNDNKTNQEKLQPNAVIDVTDEIGPLFEQQPHHLAYILEDTNRILPPSATTHLLAASSNIPNESIHQTTTQRNNNDDTIITSCLSSATPIVDKPLTKKDEIHVNDEDATPKLQTDNTVNLTNNTIVNIMIRKGTNIAPFNQTRDNANSFTINPNDNDTNEEFLSDINKINKKKKTTIPKSKSPKGNQYFDKKKKQKKQKKTKQNLNNIPKKKNFTIIGSRT